MNRDWYSVNEVADILGESYKKIYNLLVAGELGHYRVGRSYRIRKTDLEAYFAQQDKHLHPSLTAADDAVEAVVVDSRNADSRAVAAAYGTTATQSPQSPQSPRGRTPGVESVRRERSAGWQGDIDDTVDDGGPDMRITEEGETTGELETTGQLARRREADYSQNFRQQFRNGLAISHPTTDDVVRLEDWSAVEQVEDELLQLAKYLDVGILRPAQQAAYPHNVRVLYWIEPDSLGGILRRYPKEGLVIECAVVARMERFVSLGRDEERMTRADLEAMLAERQAWVARWSARYGTSIAYLAGLAAPTGWDSDAREYGQHAAATAGVLPYLIDLAALEVGGPAGGDRYLEIFDLPLGARKVRAVQQQIEALLLVDGALRLADIQSQIGCSYGLVRAACVRLFDESAEYTLIQDGNDMIMRSR